MPRIGKLVILNIIFEPLMASELTWVHDVVSADGTVINVDVYTGDLVRGGSLPQAQRATAFHFLTSKRLTAESELLSLTAAAAYGKDRM